AHDGNAIHAVLGEPRVARVAFLEQHLQAFALRPLLGEPDQVARAVEAHDVPEAAPGELEAMPALAAAQIEDVAGRLDLGRRDDEVDLAPGVLDVLDDVAVGLHIEGVEELAPPLLGQVRLEIRNRPEARTRRQASGTPRLGRHYHGGQTSSSLPASSRRRSPPPSLQAL